MQGSRQQPGVFGGVFGIKAGAEPPAQAGLAWPAAVLEASAPPQQSFICSTRAEGQSERSTRAERFSQERLRGILRAQRALLSVTEQKQAMSWSFASCYSA